MTTRTRGRRLVVATAVPALVLGGLAAVAPAAHASAPSQVMFVDVAQDHALMVGDATGAAATPLAPGMHVFSFDVGQNGDDVLVYGQTAAPTYSPLDTVTALVYSAGGTSRTLAIDPDGPGSIARRSGDAFWVENGSLRSTKAIINTLVGKLVPPPGQHLEAFAASPGGSRFAAVFVHRQAKAPYLPDASTLRLVDLKITTGHNPPRDITFSSVTRAELALDQPLWLDDTSVAYSVCTTGSCAHRNWFRVDASTMTSKPVRLPALYDHYNLRLLGSTYYAWSDTGTGSSLVTSLSTSTDLATFTPQSDRIDGDHTVIYAPVAAAPSPVAFPPSFRPGRPIAPGEHLDLSKSTVLSGGRVVYAGYALYRLDMRWGSDPFREYALGTTEYSTDAGATWRTMGTTGASSLVPWPGRASYGDGVTKALWRTTWFRWSHQHNDIFADGTSAVVKVTVLPRVRAHVTTSGASRIVYGTVNRQGGHAVLYLGRTRLAVTSISATGHFSFGKRHLVRGTYKVVTIASLSWGSGVGVVRI